jgi:hypothetical protein
MSAVTRLREMWSAPSPDFAPCWLRVMWEEYQVARSCYCPSCPGEGRIALGVSIHEHPRAYKLQCAVCAWRTPWFEPLADGRLILVGLDVP